MNFRAPYNNASVATVNHADIIIGMILLGRPAAAVAFDVGLRNGHGQIIATAMFVDRSHALQVSSPQLFVHVFCDQMKRKQAVGADFFDQDDQRAPKTRRGLDQFASL